MWVEFVYSLLYTEKFFSRNSGFPFLSKTNIWFQLNWFALIVSFSWQCLQLVLHRARTTRHSNNAPFFSFLLDTSRFPAVRRTLIRRGGREMSNPRPYQTDPHPALFTTCVKINLYIYSKVFYLLLPYGKYECVPYTQRWRLRFWRNTIQNFRPILNPFYQKRSMCIAFAHVQLLN